MTWQFSRKSVYTVVPSSIYNCKDISKVLGHYITTPFQYQIELVKAKTISGSFNLLIYGSDGLIEKSLLRQAKKC